MAAENIALVREIDGDNESWKVKVKIVRLWKQTYSNNPQVVSSIEMVLIDEQGTRIHATVKRNLIGQFDALLAEGGVRILSKFGVGQNAGRFLLTTHPCKINFYRHTSVRLSNDWAGPEQSFHLLAFKDILEGNFDFKFSFDVIGEVINCNNTKVMSINGTERRVKSLQLQNEEGIKLKVALWDEHATNLDVFLADPNRHDVRVIILLQFAKYGEWENAPQISNAMFGAKVWINADLPAFDEFKNSLLTVNAEPTTGRVLSSTTVYSNPNEYWSRFEIKNIDELMDINEPDGFVVVATLIRIQSEHGWYYHACTKCSKKVERLYKLVDENSDDEGVARFECGECGVVTDVYPKIKVQVRVQDATGSISFVLFERDVTGYVHKPASQLISNANNGEHFELFPAEFNQFVGKRFAFKIKISKYNIDNKYYVYTVNKFTDEDSVIDAILKKASGDEDSPSDVDIHVLKQVQSVTSISAKDAVSGTGENATPLAATKSTASSPPSKKLVGHDDGDLVITGSSSNGRPDVHTMKIPRLEKF